MKRARRRSDRQGRSESPEKERLGRKGKPALNDRADEGKEAGGGKAVRRGEEDS